MKKHQPYDVVLLPPANISQNAINLSLGLARKLPLEFVLDGKNRYPHLTLFQIEVPDHNIEEVKKKLRELFASQRPIISKLLNFSNHGTFIFWDCQVTTELQIMHELVLKTIEPLREKLMVSIVIKSHSSFTKKQKIQLRRFGAIGLLEDYHPHITITRLKHKGDVQMAKAELSGIKITAIQFEQAALGKLSDHGTLTEIIEIYKLK